VCDHPDAHFKRRLTVVTGDPLWCRTLGSSYSNPCRHGLGHSWAVPGPPSDLSHGAVRRRSTPGPLLGTENSSRVPEGNDRVR